MKNALRKVEHPGLVSTVLLPSTVVRLLHTENPREFRLRLGADSAKLRDFWTEFLRRPRTRDWASKHPFLQDKAPADMVSSIPCVLHTDAGPCSKSQSCNVVSWSSLLATGDEKRTRFPVCTFLKTNSNGDSQSWSLILQDFDACASGIGWLPVGAPFQHKAIESHLRHVLRPLKPINPTFLKAI